MEKAFTLLIADRNRHVREFLKREMQEEGYRILLARSGREVLGYISGHAPVDLVILDIDLPDAGDFGILEKLRKRIPTLPLVVHTFLSEYLNHTGTLSTMAFVEKNGNSIECLKRTVADILEKSHSRRSESTKSSGANE